MAEPDMKLPEGKTCKDCAHYEITCSWMIGTLIASSTTCDFSPSKFVTFERGIKKESDHE